MTNNYDSNPLLNEQTIAEIQNQEPEKAVFNRLAEIYKILSDPTRLRIIYALLKREMCVNDLVRTLGISQSSVSHALASFRSLDLVRYRKEGGLTLYSLSDEHVEQIFAMGLDHIEE